MKAKFPVNRIYHPWFRWEDFRHNFYGHIPVDNKVKHDELYADFLRDLERFEKALMIITTEWVYACEHNLTNESLNRIAYLGQAAMALEYNVPSSMSRNGYNLLSEQEQKVADDLAEKYLNMWLEDHSERNDSVNSKAV